MWTFTQLTFHLQVISWSGSWMFQFQDLEQSWTSVQPCSLTCRSLYARAADLSTSCCTISNRRGVLHEDCKGSWRTETLSESVQPSDLKIPGQDSWTTQSTVLPGTAGGSKDGLQLGDGFENPRKSNGQTKTWRFSPPTYISIGTLRELSGAVTDSPFIRFQARWHECIVISSCSNTWVHFRFPKAERVT